MRSLLDTPEAWRGVSGGGHPRAVEGWGPELQLGQVSGVSVDPQGRPVLFHRGTRVWDHRTFNVTHHYQGEDGPLGEDVVLVLDPESGAVVRSWGAGHFLLPHGLTVDQRGNTWLTDVGLHQVFKFPPGGEEPELILGEPRVPGSDNTHFCKPTSVAVASSGDFFVADGYCNARVLRFAPDGVLKDKFGHPGRDGSPSSLYVPHGLALDESLDSLCVADRENRRVVCMRAGVQEPDVFGEHLRTLQDPYHGRVFDVAAFKGALVSVGGSEGESAAMGFTTDLRDGQLKDMWRPSRGFHNPHAVALSGDGTAIYVAEIGPNRVWKFVVDSNGVGTRAMY
ncbi:peptidyl-alpha-hydroxyglycine alpha-amidating lyase 2-like isoform X4 [Eriocheir sinensis]|nr:peptidyl-alpha-hydroxyglycine alpha-amidating lyase 2-like isoform X2 [Eriocheir sinensis]XP_050687179.1 peptidyl-alpha-hydroxyglycine alpha-amidating lyase 2-like isoform X3 [Eriocheir sinensis]XP_050687181.1 peptidyl-alpha-hydroxyglycine alpha-amidating lyase 2-like isoform X4 [Eriocheir sinensis]